MAKLQAISKTGYDERIFIRGDKSTDYGAAMKVMARISGRRLQEHRLDFAAGTGSVDAR